MKKGEKLKGKNLKSRMRERDLICKDKKVHIVYGNTICRPSTIDGTKRRGKRIWIKVGSCKDYSEYKKLINELGLSYCEFCSKKLEKNGYKQI